MRPPGDAGAAWKYRWTSVSGCRSIISAINEDISSVVHIGAGYCAEAGLYRELGIQSVIFVEPDAQLFATATRKFLHSPHITVMQRAIAGKNEERVLFQISNKRFSSLLEPGRIIEYYPNLTVTDEIDVDAITLESLCDEIHIPEGKNSLLVLELQGEEANVLTHTPDHILQNFKWIVVRGSKETLYGKPSAPAEAAIKRSLYSAKFDALCFQEDNPVFCEYLFIRNDAALAKQALEEEMEVAFTDIQSLTADNLDLARQVNSLEARFEKSQQHNADLAERLDAARKQISDLSGEKEATLADIQAVTKDKLNLISEITSLDARTEKLQQHNADLAETLDAARDQISDLTGEKEELQQQINDLTTAHQSTQSELCEELKEANHALRINNKLVAKTDADLRDLQARYETAIDNQKQQHSLLLDLQEKLIQASKFYRQLDIQDQNIKGDVFGDDIESIENEPDQNDESQRN